MVRERLRAEGAAGEGRVSRINADQSSGNRRDGPGEIPGAPDSPPDESREDPERVRTRGRRREGLEEVGSPGDARGDRVEEVQAGQPSRRPGGSSRESSTEEVVRIDPDSPNVESNVPAGRRERVRLNPDAPNVESNIPAGRTAVTRGTRQQDLGDTPVTFPLTGPFPGQTVEVRTETMLNLSRDAIEGAGSVAGELIGSVDPVGFADQTNIQRRRESVEATEDVTDVATTGRDPGSLRGDDDPGTELRQGFAAGVVEGPILEPLDTLSAGKEVAETGAYVAGVTPDAEGQSFDERTDRAGTQARLFGEGAVRSARESPGRFVGNIVGATLAPSPADAIPGGGPVSTGVRGITRGIRRSDSASRSGPASFLSDSRGQADLTGPSRRSRTDSGSDSTTRITGEELSSVRARSDPTRGGRFPGGTSGSARTGPGGNVRTRNANDPPSSGESTSLGFRSAATEAETAPITPESRSGQASRPSVRAFLESGRTGRFERAGVATGAAAVGGADSRRERAQRQEVRVADADLEGDMSASTIADGLEIPGAAQRREQAEQSEVRVDDGLSVGESEIADDGLLSDVFARNDAASRARARTDSDTRARTRADMDFRARGRTGSDTGSRPRTDTRTRARTGQRFDLRLRTTPRIRGRARSDEEEEEEEEDRRSRDFGGFGFEFPVGDDLAQGWLSEQLTDAAVLGQSVRREPSEEALEAQGFVPTGEFPTVQMLEGDEETQERIEDFAGLFLNEPVDDGDGGGFF